MFDWFWSLIGSRVAPAADLEAGGIMEPRPPRPRRRRPLLIAIDGTPGAGKTSVALALAECMGRLCPTEQGAVKVVSGWTADDKKCHEECRGAAAADPQRYRCSSTMLAYSMYANVLREAMSEGAPQVVIVEGTLAARHEAVSLSTSMSRIERRMETVVYDEHARSVPHPDVFVWLKTPSAVAWKRHDQTQQALTEAEHASLHAVYARLYGTDAAKLMGGYRGRHSPVLLHANTSAPGTTENGEGMYTPEDIAARIFSGMVERGVLEAPKVHVVV